MRLCVIFYRNTCRELPGVMEKAYTTAPKYQALLEFLD
jgi:hypothetical protein